MGHTQNWHSKGTSENKAILPSLCSPIMCPWRRWVQSGANVQEIQVKKRKSQARDRAQQVECLPQHTQSPGFDPQGCTELNMPTIPTAVQGHPQPHRVWGQPGLRRPPFKQTKSKNNEIFPLQLLKKITWLYQNYVLIYIFKQYKYLIRIGNKSARCAAFTTVLSSEMLKCTISSLKLLSSSSLCKFSLSKDTAQPVTQSRALSNDGKRNIYKYS